MFIYRHKILPVLYLNNITGFRRISRQNHCSIQCCQYTFIWISGNVHSVMPVLQIKIRRHHATCRTIEYQSGSGIIIINSRQIISFRFFILLTKLFFLPGTFHQRIRTKNGQRVDRLDCISFYFPAKYILNVHDIHILPRHHLL